MREETAVERLQRLCDVGLSDCYGVSNGQIERKRHHPDEALVPSRGRGERELGRSGREAEDAGNECADTPGRHSCEAMSLLASAGTDTPE